METISLEVLKLEKQMAEKQVFKYFENYSCDSYFRKLIYDILR